MSRTQIIVRYDGPALADHRMEIEQVAPAMLALSELIKRANQIANGDRASVKILVRADVEQHCFAFGIEIVQTILEKAMDLLSDQNNIETAKKIAAWVGIVSTVGGGLFGLLRWLNGRKPDSTSLTMRDGNNVVQINVGHDMIVVPPEVWSLYQDGDAVRDAKTVTRPVTEEGYEVLEFAGRRRTTRITREDAEAIQNTPAPSPEIETSIPPSRVRAWVKIRKAVYDGKGKWNVQWDKSRDVTIADAEWLARFQRNEVSAPPGAYLDVDMTVSKIELDKRGRPVQEPEYTIVEVHEVKLPLEAGQDLFDDGPAA